MARRTHCVAASIAIFVASAAVSAHSQAPSKPRIAFTSWRDGDAQIYTMDVDGGSVRRLTSKGRNIEPAWSPDGSKIAFTSNRDGAYVLHVMDADGSNAVALPGRIRGLDPAWSPDGGRLAYGTRQGTYQIWTVGSDGKGARRLSNDAAQDWGPSWSPSGDDVVFAASDWLVVADVESGDTHHVWPLGQAKWPDWGPDGAGIAAQEYLPSDIIVVDPHSGTARNVTKTAARDARPAWSPDGARLVFDSFDRGDWNVWRVRADGAEREQLTRHPLADYEPDWFDPAVLPVSSPLQELATWGWMKTFGARVLR